MSSIAPLPSLARLAAPQSHRAPAAALLDLFAPGRLVSLSGPAPLASVVALYLAVSMASAGRRVTYVDLRENEVVGRQVWATGRLNRLHAGKHFSVSRDRMTIDHRDAPRLILAQLRDDRPNFLAIDNLAHATADLAHWSTSKFNPGCPPAAHDPLQPAWTLLEVVEKAKCAILVLTGTEQTVVDDAADVRLVASRADKIITLTAISVPGAVLPAPLQFEPVRLGDVVALKIIDSIHPYRKGQI